MTPIWCIVIGLIVIVAVMVVLSWPGDEEVGFQ
jgi:hypothetical protein